MISHIDLVTGQGTYPIFFYFYFFLIFIYILLILFCKDFIFGKRGREGEKHHCVAASRAPPTGYWAHNPGKCPDWELNQ